jgi:urate oxidase
VIETQLTMPALSKNAYGKTGIRLAKLKRDTPAGHEVVELSVDVELQGDFAEAYRSGDNSKVIATDSLKNAVYVLANDHPLRDIESFATDLAQFFSSEYAQVEQSTISIRSRPWRRISVAGAAHSTAFMDSGGEIALCRVLLARDALPELVTGIDGLALLKSADSGFSGFWEDELRTLADTGDRILATTLQASWSYAAHPGTADGSDAWTLRRESVRNALLERFATHRSESLQDTLYTLGRAALDACDAVTEIELELPNHHYLPVDLAPFGRDTRSALFLPSPEPTGRITGTVSRSRS